MKFRQVFALFLSLVIFPGISLAQKSPELYKGQIKSKVSIGSGIDANISIPATKDILRRLNSKSSKKTVFNVTYHNFPSNAKAAFQYAMDIWSAVLYTAVPVRVDAYWESTMPSGVLGSTSPGNYYRKIPGAFKYDAYYPIVLAEKIVGQVLGNQSDPDIVIHLSSTIPWYYGTDAKTPAGFYDLTTVTLHEICHGLGFTGSFYSDLNPSGSYGDGASKTPEIFDYFVKNSSGQQLIDASVYTNPSIKLGIALTTLNKVYFDGVMTRKANGLQKVTLFSPFPWSSGSSIYHVGDIYYQTANTLMYYAIDRQEAVHDPGSMLTGMMGDLGWVNTWIRHDSLPDIESISGPRTVTAGIESDTSITAGSVYLYRSFNNFVSYDSVQMQPTANPKEYSGQILIPGLGTNVSYYLSVKDIFGRIYTLPGGSPSHHFRFFAGKDTIPPVIQQQPLAFILNSTDSVKMSATVIDNLGIDTVYIEYIHNNGTSVFRGMKKDSLSSYSGYIDFSSFSIIPGDSIGYRIVAKDKSVSNNVSYSPPAGYYFIPVVNVPEPVSSYYTTFDSINHDFVFSGFEISKPAGFSSPCLNSDHPYSSPEIDNAHYDYFAQLRVPIILNQTNAFIMFDEVALVEPNDSGYSFGSEGYYDYVIVEGSKDGGNNWNYFTEGWNCTEDTAWFNRFESDLDVNNNSHASGDLGLFRKRNLDMLTSGNFHAGDTVLIRFHLYSDPYVYGWGWAIDNLIIQDLAMGISSSIQADSKFQLFPNPAAGLVNFKLQLDQAPANVKIQLINIQGQVVVSEDLNNPGTAINEKIAVDALQNGVYLAVVFIDGTRFVRKLSIVK